MAEPYLTELRDLAIEWTRADPGVGDLACRHFFSGAAAYRDGTIVATLTPVGLAFKVAAKLRDELLARGVASELRYFPDAPIKRDCVLFSTVIEPDAAVRLLRGDTLSG